MARNRLTTCTWGRWELNEKIIKRFCSVVHLGADEPCTLGGFKSKIPCSRATSILRRSAKFTSRYSYEISLNVWFIKKTWPSKASFCLKKSSKATKAKKVNEGQQRPAKSKTSKKNYLYFIVQSKTINKCEYDTKKMCFYKIWNFHFHYINFLKLHFENMLSFSKVYDEIMVLLASFVSMLHEKSEISSTSFHQWKYY
jgi:hypothetical protein